MSFIRNAFDQKRELNSNLSETLHKLQRESRGRLPAEESLIRQNDFLHHVFESVTHPFYVVNAEDYTVVKYCEEIRYRPGVEHFKQTRCG